MKKIILAIATTFFTLTAFTQNAKLKKVNRDLKNYPDQLHLYYERALIYNDLKQYQDALNDIETMELADSKIMNWHIFRWEQYKLKAQLLHQLGKDNLALLAWDKTIDAKKEAGIDRSEEYGERGDIYFGMGNYAQALYSYYKIIWED